MKSILKAERVAYFMADQHMAAAEGIARLPATADFVDSEEKGRARRLIAEAGLGKELLDG